MVKILTNNLSEKFQLLKNIYLLQCINLVFKEIPYKTYIDASVIFR